MWGSGLVDITDYYHATVLTQLKKCFFPEAHSLWGTLERHVIPNRNLKLWMCSLHPKSLFPTCLPPTINTSIKIWQKCISTTWESTPLSPIKLPISTLQLLIPDLSLNPWPKWSSVFLDDLLQNGQVKPFHQLKKDLELPTSTYYQYLQIAHCLQHNLHLLSPNPECALTLFSPHSKSIRGISMFYNLLHKKMLFQRSSFFLQWEPDLAQNFSAHQWKMAFHSIYKIQKSWGRVELEGGHTSWWHKLNGVIVPP